MNRETLAAVLDGYRLPDGTVWTVPVTIQATGDAIRGFGVGDRVALRHADGKVHSLLDVDDIFQLDLAVMAQQCFGTDSPNHPGVARLFASGDTFVGGEVTLVTPLPSPYTPFELSPRQTRFIFNQKGWTRVIGFHSRNACHRVHEFLQLKALEETGADGLLINPVIGPKGSNGYMPEPIIRSYQTALEFGYLPKGRVVLGSISSFSRDCGPREAVFTALCRKNMGCSDFIVGSGHTAVGDFYPADANRRLFEELGDIGITPLFFDAIGYDEESRTYRQMDESGTVNAVGSAAIREKLADGERLPDWTMRDVVQDTLLAEIAAGRPMFFE
jgi:ATP sulfurylase